MRYHIKVRQDHIDSARAILATANTAHARCNICPIAQAVREQTPYRRATVSVVFLHYGEGEKDVARLPSPAFEFVQGFDYDGRWPNSEPAPFEFEIDLPEVG